MGNPVLKCSQLGAKTVYEHLIQQGYASRLDAGYRVLDYRNPANPGGTLHGADENGNGDGEVTCEEFWENSLILLDEWGQQKETAVKYQKLRKLIETQTRRPIPWVLEAPTVGVSSKKRRAIEKDVQKIRKKIQKAVGFLEKLLAPLKAEEPAKYQRCLVACLYWFVLVPENGQGIPPEFESFLARQDINADVIQRIRGEFSKYLQKNGGGLGLANIGPDAETEATALETVLKRRGWCTEQSKVMYAIFRMAGIEAFFVEPGLSVEYFMATQRTSRIPLQSHMASGVGVKITDEHGNETVWIIDTALKLLEANYIRENSGQWKAHPYWGLSLRHFYMADLANLGRDQTNYGRYAAAEQNFEIALRLGKDSTAFHAMGNYAQLLGLKSEYLSRRSRGYHKSRERLERGINGFSKGTLEINPNNPAFQYNRGRHLWNKKRWQESEGMILAFLSAIVIDPRYPRPYQALGEALYGIRENSAEKFFTLGEELKRQIHRIKKYHPKLNWALEKGLEVMETSVPRGKPFSAEVMDLIGELKKLTKI